MRLTDKHIDELTASMHIVHRACLHFRMRALAHRLINFGFESLVNTLTGVELLHLAVLLPHYQHNVLVAEAMKRDPTIAPWLQERFPELAVTCV